MPSHPSILIFVRHILICISVCGMVHEMALLREWLQPEASQYFKLSLLTDNMDLEYTLNHKYHSNDTGYW